MALALITMSGCGTSESGGVISWNNTSAVSEELVMLTGDEPIVLGSLDTHGIEVKVPANAFEIPTEVALMPLEEEVEVDSPFLNQLEVYTVLKSEVINLDQTFLWRSQLKWMKKCCNRPRKPKAFERCITPIPKVH